ncbi:MAG: hypothetical protein IIY88_07455 [Eubacterium sp.]|nr:hypothetical protein [Eubacterium sp.]
MTSTKKEKLEIRKGQLGSRFVINDIAMNEELDLSRIADAYYSMGFSRMRIRQWKKTVFSLAMDEWKRVNGSGNAEKAPDRPGVFYELAKLYADVSAKGSDVDPGWYLKLPKQNDTYCAVGFILRQTPETVDKWIEKNTQKPRLYDKSDSDLAWVLLLRANSAKSEELSRDLRRCFEDCRDDWEEEHGGETFNSLDYFTQLTMALEQLHEEMVARLRSSYGKYSRQAEGRSILLGTIDVRSRSETFVYSREGIEHFVKDNIGAFRGAYQKPKDILLSRAEKLMAANDRTGYDGYLAGKGIREFLMAFTGKGTIEYLLGNRPQDIPRNKSSFIRLGLSLGMTLEPLNELLVTAGFDRVGIIDDQSRMTNSRAQFLLIRMLSDWEKENPEQRAWRLAGGRLEHPEAERKALSQMLGEGRNSGLMGDMKAIYEKVSNGEPFPYSWRNEV